MDELMRLIGKYIHQGEQYCFPRNRETQDLPLNSITLEYKKMCISQGEEHVAWFWDTSTDFLSEACISFRGI